MNGYDLNDLEDDNSEVRFYLLIDIPKHRPKKDTFVITT